MRNVWVTSSMPAGRAALARDTILFKRDRPRAIDQYIDYFGDSGARPAAREMVEDVLLETPA